VHQSPCKHYLPRIPLAFLAPPSQTVNPRRTCVHHVVVQPTGGHRDGLEGFEHARRADDGVGGGDGGDDVFDDALGQLVSDTLGLGLGLGLGFGRGGGDETVERGSNGSRCVQSRSTSQRIEHPYGVKPLPALLPPPPPHPHITPPTGIPYCLPRSTARSYTHFMCSSLSASNSSAWRCWDQRMRWAYSMQWAALLVMRERLGALFGGVLGLAGRGNGRGGGVGEWQRVQDRVWFLSAWFGTVA